MPPGMYQHLICALQNIVSLNDDNNHSAKMYMSIVHLPSPPPVVSLNSSTLPRHHTLFRWCVGVWKVSRPLRIAASTVDDFAADAPSTLAENISIAGERF